MKQTAKLSFKDVRKEGYWRKDRSGDIREFDLDSTWEEAMKTIKIPSKPGERTWICQSAHGLFGVYAVPKEKIRKFVEMAPHSEVHEVFLMKSNAITYRKHKARTEKAEEENRRNVDEMANGH